MSTNHSITRHDTTVTYLRNPRYVFLGRALWVCITLLTLLVLAATLPLFRQSQLSPEMHQQLLALGFSSDQETLYYAIAQIFQVVAFVGVGTLIFSRKSNDWMAVLVSAMLITTAMNLIEIPTTLFDQQALWRVAVAIVFFVGNVTFFVFLLVFPDGNLVPKRYGRALIVLYILWTLVEAFFRHLNPSTDPAIGETLELVTSLVWVGGIFAQIYRYRRVSTIQQRQQTKWVILGMILGVVGLIATNVIDLLIASSLSGQALAIYALIIAPILDIVPVMLGLLAVTFAVMRYRLWDIDLAINRSLVYGAVTLILCVVFLGGALIIQSILGEGNSTIGLAVSVVIAAMTFDPLRKRIQNIIDRRFYGLRFDLNELNRAQRLPNVENPGSLTGTTVANFSVLGVIGKGGMGEVYKGVGNGQTVAIKVLNDPELVNKAEQKIRFEREAKALTELDHPHIVKFVSSGIFNNIPYIAMEFVDGVELGLHIKKNGRFEVEDARVILKDIANALDYAHAKGMVHRDIKASNIMLRLADDQETYRGVLMDFGVAKIKDGQTNLTGTGAVGTIDYMAPEQIEESKTVDQRADIYALGVVLYEMLTGERPFKGTSAQVLFAHIQQPAPDPRDIVPNLPRNVAHAITRALHKDPNQRFATAGEFLNMIA